MPYPLPHFPFYFLFMAIAAFFLSSQTHLRGYLLPGPCPLAWFASLLSHLPVFHNTLWVHCEVCFSLRSGGLQSRKAPRTAWHSDQLFYSGSSNSITPLGQVTVMGLFDWRWEGESIEGWGGDREGPRVASEILGKQGTLMPRRPAAEVHYLS